MVNSECPSSGRTWSIATTSGYTAVGYLPGWAEADPSQSGVPAERLHIALTEVTHHAVFGGQFMRVTCGPDEAAETAVLIAGIECRPFAEEPEPRAPVASVQIIDDYWVRDLNPGGVLEVAAQFRAFADLLAVQVAPALAAAVAEWATYGAPAHLGGSPQP